MKILVIGNGGREHALCMFIKQSPICKKIYCIPGSDSIKELADCFDINPMNNTDVVNGAGANANTSPAGFLRPKKYMNVSTFNVRTPGTISNDSKSNAEMHYNIDNLGLDTESDNV